MIPYPKITGKTEREKTEQIRSYLYQLADQLTFELQTIKAAIEKITERIRKYNRIKRKEIHMNAKDLVRKQKSGQDISADMKTMANQNPAVQNTAAIKPSGGVRIPQFKRKDTHPYE